MNQPSEDNTARPEGEAYCPTCDKSYPQDAKICPKDGTRLVDLSRPIDPMIGRQIDGRFTIRERLGAGGMGVVYRAWQASVGREVAIKVIAPRPGDDSSTAKRFLREAKLASQLSQPNIVMVIDFGATEDGTLYLAMELLRGRTLSQVYRKDGALSPRRVQRIGSQLCDALEAAHKAGIIHRDLKPANVMILDEPAGRDFVKVLDFGLAKALDGEHESTLTQSDRVVGTPSYMAPEVIQGASAEPRSDLYSVGVMLFEMLTKRLPYAAPNANVMLAKHAYAPVPDLDPTVPPQVAYVVKLLLQKRPDQRPDSAAVLRDMIEDAVAGRLIMEPGSDEALVETREESVTGPRALQDLSSSAATARPARATTTGPNRSAASSAQSSPASIPGSQVGSPGPTTYAQANISKSRWGMVLIAIALAGAAGAAVAVVMSKNNQPAPTTTTDSEGEGVIGNTDNTGSARPAGAVTPDAAAAVAETIDGGVTAVEPPVAATTDKVPGSGSDSGKAAKDKGKSGKGGKGGKGPDGKAGKVPDDKAGKGTDDKAGKGDTGEAKVDSTTTGDKKSGGDGKTDGGKTGSPFRPPSDD